MQSRSTAIRNFLLGGLLPVVAYALVDSFCGTKVGLIAGMAAGVGEIAWEKWRLGKVQGVTWLSNFLVLALGALSLYEDSGVFFKLQPAIFMLLFSGLCIGSSVLKRPFLVELARKQNPDLPPAAWPKLAAMNFRLGFLFLGLTLVSVHAAYYWSTAAWAILKGVGLPLLLGVYVALEILVARWLAGRTSAPRGRDPS
jgi:intracellular septation protein